ncbi:hypothetical protein [Streptomyces sp. NPDC058872]|uniref:hypothetical protein n=1 Tax=Streptomyces sp. NPDC058872 TaxID=3346661 RepID=UPI0036D1F42F
MGGAHLITVQQFADVVAQETYREPGQDVELTEVLATGRSERGPGRYETLVCPGALDGLPVPTFTAPWRMADVEVRRPVAAYVRQPAHGLKAPSTWSDEEIAGDPSDRPGARGHLTPEAVMELRADGVPRGEGSRETRASRAAGPCGDDAADPAAGPSPGRLRAVSGPSPGRLRGRPRRPRTAQEDHRRRPEPLGTGKCLRHW